MITAQITLDSGAITIANVAYNAGGTTYNVRGGLKEVSDITYKIDSARNFENSSFTVTIQNLDYYIDGILAGADKNLRGHPIVITWRTKTIAVGQIKDILESGPEVSILECDRNRVALEEDLGEKITRAVFPDCHEEAEGQFVARWAGYGVADVVAKGDGFGNIVAWRVAANTYILTMWDASSTLSKAYSNAGTDITASCTLTTGTYGGETREIIQYTSPDAYIFVNATSSSTVPSQLRYTGMLSSGTYFFDNMDGMSYTIWGLWCTAVGLDNSLFITQESKQNFDFLTELADCFDLYICPIPGTDAFPAYGFYHLQTTHFYPTNAEYEALDSNWNAAYWGKIHYMAMIDQDFKQRIDYTHIWTDLIPQYKYHHGVDDYKRAQSNLHLASDYQPKVDGTPLNIQKWKGFKHVVNAQTALRLGLRWLFYYNKPHYYYRFRINFSIVEANQSGHELRVGSYIKINVPKGCFKNTDRICMVTSLTYQTSTDSVAMEVLDITAMTSGMKDIKLHLISNNANGSNSFLDQSPEGQHTITAYGGIVHDTTVKKFGRSSIYFDKSDNILEVETSADWDITDHTNYTIGFWFQRYAASGSYEVVLGQQASGTVYWGIGIDAKNKFYYVHRPPGGIAASITSAVATTDTNMHFITLCKVGTDFGLYIDGTIQAYMSDAQTGSYDPAVLRIGAWDNGSPPTYPLKGYLPEIIYSTSNYFGAAPDAGLTDTITDPTQWMTWNG